MTVTTTTAALLAWAFALSIFLNFYWATKLARTKDALETNIRISAHNSDYHARAESTWVAEVLTKAQLTDPLPPLNASKWSRLVDLYDDPELMAYDIPAQITTDHDDRPAVYWKRTSVSEFEAYELARLWLNGVL
jgi:hypothetical protein